MGETQSFHSIHPGTIFKEEPAARGLGAASFALHLRVPPRRIQEDRRRQARDHARDGIAAGL